MKKQSGFTLIELMVVMAIIAILATAGLSAYTGYLKNARDSARIVIAKQIGIKVEQLSTITGAPTPEQLEAFLNAEGFAWNVSTPSEKALVQLPNIASNLL
jgi:type IV pilus assembly protein PilA